MRSESVRLSLPLLWVLGFIVTVAIYAIGGVVLVSRADDYMQDSYYVVVHVHRLLPLAALFASFAGIYHWFPKVSGKTYNTLLGHLHFWFFFVGVNWPPFLVYCLGLDRIEGIRSDDSNAFAYWSRIAAVGYALIAIGTVLFLANIAYSLRPGRRA